MNSVKVWVWRDKTGVYLDQDEKGECGCVLLEKGKKLGLKIGELRCYKLVEIRKGR